MENQRNLNPKWFTNNFLELVLRKSEKDDTISIVDSNVEEAAEKGAHYASTMFRITMNIKRESVKSEKKSIIIKVLPEKEMRELVSNSTAFPREIKMFSDILPKMHALLENVKPGVKEAFGAKCYFSENQNPFVLMLEDLSVRGFMLADRSVGLDLPHAMLVMKTLGRFHASSVVLYEQQPEQFDIFSRSMFFESKEMVDSFKNMCHNRLKNMIAVVKKWENGGERLAQKLSHRLETIMDDFRKAYTCDPNEFNVLIHGDLWINNMMFRYDNNTADVKDVLLVDFQICNIASPAVDLQYFIHTSIRDDVREHHIEELLLTYHNELVKTLTLLKYKGKIFSIENFFDAYKKRAVVGLLWSLVALPLMMNERGVKHDIDELMKDDADVTHELPMTKECEVVLRRLLPLFESRGVL